MLWVLPEDVEHFQVTAAPKPLFSGKTRPRQTCQSSTPAFFSERSQGQHLPERCPWRHQAYQLQTVRHLLERQVPRQETLPFLDEHPLIRPLSEYGQFIHQSFQGETTHV